MKHIINKLTPDITTIISAIIAIISGIMVQKYGKLLTDFEIILVIISVFALAKGTLSCAKGIMLL